MNNQKGQVQALLFIAILIFGIVSFFIFFGSEKIEIPKIDLFQSKPSQKETIISPPSQDNTVEPLPVSISDNSPPIRSNGQPSGSLPASTRKTNISLETDEKSVCRYGTVAGQGYHSMNHVFSSADSTYHTAQVTGLSEGQMYQYYIKCADESDNINTNDFVILFMVKKPDDLTPPVRSNQYPIGDALHYLTTNTVIGISTDEPASCRYDFEQGKPYSAMQRSLADDGTKKYHTATITGLSSGHSYSYFVRCRDMAGNVNTGDVMIYFSVK